MTLILRLAAQSLRSRLLTTWLTITSIALSVTLLVGIEHVRVGVRESFAGTISGTDLIVGARGGSLQVLLSTVFGIGSPAGSVSIGTFERWKSHPAVKWAVPYTLGDSHRGFRVVGTTSDFFERYRFRKSGRVSFSQGRAPAANDEVAVGFDVQEKLRYGLGAPVVVTHGMMDIGTSNHEAHPFHVVGILGRTFTPIDRSVYMTLDGVEAMHAEMPGKVEPKVAVASDTAVVSASKVAHASPAKVAAEPAIGHGDDQITAFFVGTKNRFEALMLQREMNTDFAEPLTAVIPGVALAELFNSIGSAEVGLRVVALFAVAIGLTGMLVALYSSLDARRREMAILRAVGAGPRTIVSLLVIESGLLAFLGCVIGVGFVYVGLILGQAPIEQRFGLHLAIRGLQSPEYVYLASTLASGMLVGFVPAWKAYRTSLADGLSSRA